MADVAMRAILVTFVAAPSTVKAFMRSEMYSCRPLQPSNEAEEASQLLDAAVQFIKLLATTLRRAGWRQYRSFMKMLQNPTIDAGRFEEAEPDWLAESVWIQQRLKSRSEVVDWHEWECVMTDSPFILLLLISKAFPTKEARKEAMLCIPVDCLNASFSAEMHTQNRDIHSPHFVALCLHETTEEFALEVFLKQ